MSTQQAAPGQQSAGAGTDQGPAARYSGAWFRVPLIRHAMVIVMLLVIAYFSYRSARFGTLDNMHDHPGRRRAVRTHRARADPRHPHRRHRPVGRQRDRGERHGRRGDGQGTPGTDLADSLAGGAGRRPGGRRGQRILVSRKVNVPPFIATLGTLTAGSGLAYVIGGGAPINGLPGEFGKIANTKILGLQIPVLVMIVGIVVLGAGACAAPPTACASTPSAATATPPRSPASRPGRSCSASTPSAASWPGCPASCWPRASSPGRPTWVRVTNSTAIAAVVIGGASLLGGRGHDLGNAAGPAAHPDPQQRPRHPGGPRLLAERHQGRPHRRRRRGRRVVHPPTTSSDRRHASSTSTRTITERKELNYVPPDRLPRPHRGPRPAAAMALRRRLRRR